MDENDSIVWLTFSAYELPMSRNRVRVSSYGYMYINNFSHLSRIGKLRMGRELHLHMKCCHTKQCHTNGTEFIIASCAKHNNYIRNVLQCSFSQPNFNKKNSLSKAEHHHIQLQHIQAFFL